MTTLPRPTKETYIDFLRRKLKGRNISPEFMARNPAYFDLRGEDAPTTPATWETFYRKAKPKTSVDSGRDEGLFYPDPPNNIPYTKDGIFHAPDGSIHVDMPKAYRDYYLAQADRTITNAPREFERAVNEFTTGFPDFRSQDSIKAQQSALIDGKTAYDTPGYSSTGFHNSAAAKEAVEANRLTQKQLDDYRSVLDKAGLFDMTNTTLKDEFQNANKWGWQDDKGRVWEKGEHYVDTLDRGLFPNLEGPIGNLIRDEIWGPVERGIGEVKDFINDPGKYVDDVIKNLDTKDVVSGLAGGGAKTAATIAGMGMFPATALGYGVGTIVDMMMSPGHGQIGMPGQVEHSIPITHADGTKGWSTTYSPDVISHFNSDGIAVNKDGDPVLTPGPMHSPTSGHYQYGTPTESNDDGYGGDDFGMEDELGMAMP